MSNAGQRQDIHCCCLVASNCLTNGKGQIKNEDLLGRHWSEPSILCLLLQLNWLRKGIDYLGPGFLLH